MGARSTCAHLEDDGGGGGGDGGGDDGQRAFIIIVVLGATLTDRLAFATGQQARAPSVATTSQVDPEAQRSV